MHKINAFDMYMTKSTKKESKIFIKGVRENFKKC